MKTLKIFYESIVFLFIFILLHIVSFMRMEKLANKIDNFLYVKMKKFEEM